MSVLGGIFIIVVVALVIGAIAVAREGGLFTGDTAKVLAELRLRIEQQAAALREAQDTLADQTTQIAELQERVDFAERLLTQAREKAALGDPQPRS